MQPEVGEGLAGERLGLRDFVFVVAKDQVLAASMQVERFPQLLHRHDGALDVPARSAAADLRLPECLPWFRSFPEREVARVVFLVLVYIDASTVLHPFKIFLRELAV